MESPLYPAADAASVHLIETALWDGAGCPRLALHLARLGQSAQKLGRLCDAAKARALLLSGPSGQMARMRLTLDAAGALKLTQAALPPSPPLWRLGQATARLNSHDPWLQIKSTRREVYDLARQNMGAAYDELVFQNEHGEVCDGTITSVFFDRGEGLRTPPLKAGLLPGVLRAELIGAAKCHEEALLAKDLPHVQLWVGNALRGLMPAIWQG